jgi:hypothetical protein
MNTPINPTSLEEVVALAKVYAKVPSIKAQHNSLENVIFVILYCLEHGIKITEGLQMLYSSKENGRITAQAELMLSMVYSTGKLINIDEKVVGDLSKGDETDDEAMAQCIVERAGMPPKTFSFTVKQAKRAGLWNKQGVTRFGNKFVTPWVTYPERMMKAKARSLAMKDLFSDVVGGLISEEEASDVSFHKQQNRNGAVKEKGVQLTKIEKKPEITETKEDKELFWIDPPEVKPEVKDKKNKKESPDPFVRVRTKEDIRESKVFKGEKYVEDPHGKFHFKSGPVYSEEELDHLKTINKEERLIYHKYKLEREKGNKNLFHEIELIEL